MSKYLIFTFAFLFVWSFQSFAEPADPNVRKTITLNDGTNIECSIVGDEDYHYWKDANDNLYIEDTNGGSYIKTDCVEVGRRAKEKSQMRKSMQMEPFTPATGLSGKQHMLAILVEFPNAKFQAGHDTQFYNEILNAKDFRGYGFDGSVRDYFYDQSRGMLDLTFDIVGPIMMPEPYEYYGINRGNGANCTYEMIKTALRSVDAYVDYSQYVWAGMERVCPINIIYAGLSESSSGDTANIWSACTYVDDCYDGVMLDRVAYSSELRKVGKTEIRVCGIGAICHELAHGFGLPDMYDQTAGTNNYGTQTWDLMDIGCHSNYGITPSGMTAFDKYALGWIEPVLLCEDTNVTNMRAASENGTCYKIQHPCYENEFYLLEYRKQDKWDKYLAGHGMLIMHVDYDKNLFENNIVNRTGDDVGNDHERCRIILADNDPTRTEDSYAGDLWPYRNNNALTSNSTPAAILFNKNVDESYMMHKDITDISETSGAMSFNFTNTIDKQYYGLAAYADSIQFTSESSFIYEIGLHNTQNRVFDQNLKFTLYKKTNGKYTELETLSQASTIEALSHKMITINFYNVTLDDSKAEYFVRSFYQSQKNADRWQQLAETRVNTDALQQNHWSLSDNYMYVAREDGSATIAFDITNISFKDSDIEFDLLTYFEEDGRYVKQEPRSTAYQHIGAYETKHFTFELTGLERDKEYHVIPFYYNDQSSAKDKWIQLRSAYRIIVDESSIAASKRLDNNLNRLSASSSVIQITSESTLCNALEILNKKAERYDNQVKFTLCKLVDGEYKELKSTDTHTSIATNGCASVSCEFNNSLFVDANAQYYIFTFFKAYHDSDYWQQLAKTKINIKTLGGNNLTASDDCSFTASNDNCGSLTVKITNNSYLPYDRKIGLYTKYPDVSGWQEPRAFVTKRIKAYGTEEYTFDLTKMERDKEYIAYLYYIPVDGAGWEAMPSTYRIIVNDSTITLSPIPPSIDQSDAHEECTIYTLDGAFVTRTSQPESLSHLPQGLYIVKPKNGSVRKLFIR